MVQTAPARYSYGTCDSYSTQPTHKDVNADTAAWLRGLDYTAQRQQVGILGGMHWWLLPCCSQPHPWLAPSPVAWCRVRLMMTQRPLFPPVQIVQLAIHYRKVPQAIGAAEMSPETAADNLTFVARYYGPLLEAKAPGGDSVLVAHPVGLVEMLGEPWVVRAEASLFCQLAPRRAPAHLPADARAPVPCSPGPLFLILSIFAEGALQCCDLLLMKEELLQPREALLTAAAAAEVLSHLSFGSQASAAPYQTIWLNLKTRLSASAAALGPAAVPEEAVVGLYESCARGPLHMTPWFGHTFADAAEHHLQAGFSGPKVCTGWGRR
jgi:hypothetical protein